MQTLIIVNPAADQGSAGERIAELESVLKANNLSYRITMTERAWHAADLAERAAVDGFHSVAIAGGDGTANEVINGLMRVGDGPDSRPILHCFSIGRGNDFAYGVGIPTDLNTSAKMLKDGKTKLLDVGHLKGGDFPDGRYFGNGIGIGFDAIVGMEASKLTKLTGFTAYAVAAMKTMLMFPDAPMVDLRTSKTDIRIQAHQVSIMNGQRMGGGFYMAPDAVVNDGNLDMCMARKVNRGQMVSLILKYLKGAQNGNKHITVEQGSTFAVSSEQGGLVAHADGETICTNGTSIEVRCLPSQLRIVTS